jgi:hypothetical protein
MLVEEAAAPRSNLQREREREREPDGESDGKYDLQFKEG